MAKKHLKRIAAPSTWMVDRKERKFIAMPKGSFRRAMGMPLITVLKDVLKLVTTRKEGKRVLNSKEILVNGRKRKDEKFMIGLMDVLTIKDIGKSYRMLLDRNNILRLVPIAESEASVKPGKITGKRSVKKGRIQLSLHDGRSLLGEAAHSIGDTVILDLQKGNVAQHLKLESGCHAYLTGGSNVGKTGVVGNITGDKVTIKIGNETIEAAKRFVFVIGKDKPAIKSVASVSEEKVK